MRALDLLRAELGAGGVRAEPALLADGVVAEGSYRPESAEELAQALKVLGDADARVLLRGLGHRMDFGNLPEAADLVIELDALAGVDEFDADDGVLHAGAATPLLELARVAEEGGWELPLEAPPPGASLGGLLATAASGPRLPSFGPARDNVLGLDVVLANGDRTRCGGRVVKNVTGYDLAKLYTGSLGTLGVFEGAWLRLRARPAACTSRVVAIGDGAGRSSDALQLARLETARAAVLMDSGAARASGIAAAAAEGAPGSGDLLWLELAGEAPAVERDAQRAIDLAGAEVGREGVHDLGPLGERPGNQLGEWLGATPDFDGQAGARVRFSCAPSALPCLWLGLAELARERVAYPSLARVMASVPLVPDPPRRIGELRALAKKCGATLLFESLPAPAKRGLDVFDAAPATVPLMRALKQRFDPKGLLNPGRFAGGL